LVWKVALLTVMSTHGDISISAAARLRGCGVQRERDRRSCAA
jgi:hypothetical protein